MGFLSKAKLKSTEIMAQAVDFLISKYNAAENVFSIASPFGQILAVIANISELIFTYISHTAEELNIQTAQNHETIFGLSRLVGHDPYRGSSAYGIMMIKLNTQAYDIIDGRCLIIKNLTRLTISENGEKYFLNLPNDTIKLELGNSEFISVGVIQGEIESQTFTSNGDALQTFNPIVKTMTDNDNVSVTVNGKEWKKVDALYDMPADNGYDDDCECYMAKSSINVGLTIIFGNGSFGKIPPAGSEIVVTYIKTSGSSGNLFTPNLKYTFIDSGFDEYGNDVNLNNVLDIQTLYTPMLGSDYETPDFTKLIAPKTSKSFVLANPDNYVSFLSKYNQFSFIYAYNTKDDEYIDDDNITYLKILPNIKRKLSESRDYFDIPAEEFKLTDAEKEAVMSAIENSGRQLIGTEVQIDNTIIQRFAINIIIRYFENAEKTSIRSDIRKLLGQYFLNINRNDIIPLSDIISLVEGIDGVDTCDVFFTTEKNESAKINGGYYTVERVWENLRHVYKKKYVTVGRNTDPKVGFDDFGNIIVNNNEFYIPRGGWFDNEGNYYTESPETGKLGPLNIFFLDRVAYSAYNKNMQNKLTNLLKNNY